MARQAGTYDADSFLAEFDLRPLTLDGVSGLDPVGLALGAGSGALEVAVTKSASRPAKNLMMRAWRARLDGRAVPLLMVDLYQDRAAICGPSGDEPPVFFDLDPDQVKRLCTAALNEPDRHAAARFLRSVMPQVESRLPGLRNEGLFATHELDYGVPNRDDWAQAKDKAAGVLAKRGQDLLHGLGYQIDRLPGPASLLRVGQTKVAVAIFLDRNEACDVASDRFGGVSPVSYALAKADNEGLAYVVVDHGSSLRIYPTATGIGTGRRGRTETFIEIHLDLLPSEKAAYLWLLFSGEALTKGGSFEEILGTSADYAADLGARLRERIYDFVVPDLAMAIVKARNLRKPTAQDLAVTYEMALTVLFRLLFIAYAEDKDLLPCRTNDRYRHRSLKHKARELARMKAEAQGDLAAWRAMFDAGDSHWREFVALCDAVNKGNREWGVPEYNGGMFSDQGDVSPVGAELAGISVPNTTFGPILTHLLVDETPEGFGPVDFRSLGVREFGTIYEGLLESELSIAEVDLVTVPGPKGDLYEPAGEGQTPAVRKGEIYLHNASGARKATGSYYTKHFAVEHLLDHSLEPALAEHLQRLDNLDDRKAGEALFDFRVADIAMGSGHFLIAAVDRIEKRFSNYITGRTLPAVTGELQRLRAAAKRELEKVGLEAEAFDIEDNLLLRRQIARRCVYGVDINPVAVQLARLSLWIHTFVPGLPLSFLDHNIVPGNSLVGIATFDEVSDLLDLSGGGLFAATAETLIGDAREAVGKLARLSDATAAEIKSARKAYEEERKAIAPTERMLDILTASRLPESEIKVTAEDFKPDSKLFTQGLHNKARKVMAELPPFHFPIAFPEVFLRDRAGFDVILGNPPWEEATLEEHAFWARHMPGLRSQPQHEQERLRSQHRQERPDLVHQYEQELTEAKLLRRVLVTGPFKGMGTGDPDVYKAFAWRFWHLLADDSGRLGVVLPRSAFCAKGSAEFRMKLFAEGAAHITFLLNNGRWVFPEVHPQYTIGLCALHKGASERTLTLAGPFRSQRSFSEGVAREPAVFSVDEVLGWTDTAALPLLPAEGSAETFAQLRKAPRLDLDQNGQWRARPHRELDATNDKDLMEFVEKRPGACWPVFKGESFDIWQPDTGVYYAWAEPDAMREHLQQKRARSSRNRRSPFFEFADNPAWLKDPKTLACMHARIAFRDVTNRTNRRTVIAALLPPKVFITNKGPYFLWPRGDQKDQAFLLGVLCSIPLDWYARRFVETTVNYHILNGFPIPRPQRDNPPWQRTVELAGRLACPDKRFAEWASAVGVEYGPLPEDEKEEMIFELDAVVAHLYGLSEAQLRHIFETFHEGWDYQPRLDAVMRHFKQWTKSVS